ncbi:hypothetical protein BGZ68_008097 [Mortierella alpina]|nr:hypothetical protein BGZ68_008097 [Mortierella alpina]
MTRPTDHNKEEYSLPMYQAHPPPYQHSANNHTHNHVHSHVISTSNLHAITINSSSASTSPRSPSLQSSLTSPSHPQQPRRKSLQVHWHPSVNRRQAAKRNRQIAYMLAILFFFSSVTLLLFHYSGCDLATGQCQRSKRRLEPASMEPLSQHGRKRLPVPAAVVFGDDGLMMDDDTAVAGAGRLRLDPEQSWSQLSGRLKLDWEPSRQPESLMDDNGGSSSGVSSPDQALKDPSDEDGHRSTDPGSEGKKYAELDYSLGRIIIVGEEDALEEDEDHPDDMENETQTLRGNAGATPQEAYVDIWSEPSDTLSEDDYQELEEDYLVLSKLEEAKQQQQQQHSLHSRLDASVKYMTYLPYAGLTNQFYSMLRAIMIAKSLDRTLILPPITASSHDKTKQNQPWSSYFDLDTFMYLTGVKVIEFHDLREPDRIAAAESLKCHITCGVGSLRPLDFSAKEFLKQWKFDLATTPLDIETTEFSELVPALQSLEDEHMLCITHGYKIAVPKKEEWDLYGRYFYFTPAVERFFAGVLEKMAADTLQTQMSLKQRYMDEQSDQLIKEQWRSDSTAEDLHELQQEQQRRENEHEHSENSLDGDSRGLMNSAIAPETELYDASRLKVTNDNNEIQMNNAPIPSHGPFISIHVRRGDFIDYCQQHFQHALKTCLPTTQELASTLQDLLVADPSLRDLPVYVSTNEDRPEELAQFRYLGWHVLDHQRIGSREKLGVFGAMMMDQIFMAQAQVLIGVRTSTFSRVGAYRQEDWYGRKAVFM